MKNRFFSSGFVFLLLTCFFCTVNILHTTIVGKSVYGDGRYYVSMLDSIVRDQDLNMTNQYNMFSITEKNTMNNIPAQKYPIGFSILLFPIYSFLQYFIIGYKIYPLFVQYILSIYGSLTAISGLFFLWLVHKNIFGERIALYSTLSIALCTNLLFYGAVDTVNSHPYSFFLACVLLAVLYLQRLPLPLGIFSGLLYLVRPQDLICSLPAFLYKPMFKRIIFLFLPISLAVILQTAINYKIFGTLLVSGYFESGNEGFLKNGFHILEVLFSSKYGLFTVTPIIVLSFIGLFIERNKRFLMKSGIFLVFILQLFIVSTWSTWSQGASYSGRMFVSVLPLLSLGLSNFYASLQKLWNSAFIVIIIITSFTLLNSISIIRFLLMNE